MRNPPGIPEDLLPCREQGEVVRHPAEEVLVPHAQPDRRADRGGHPGARLRDPGGDGQGDPAGRH